MPAHYVDLLPLLTLLTLALDEDESLGSRWEVGERKGIVAHGLIPAELIKVMGEGGGKQEVSFILFLLSLFGSQGPPLCPQRPYA